MEIYARRGQLRPRRRRRRLRRRRRRRKRKEGKEEKESVDLGEKSRPRRMFDDPQARWAWTLRTGNLITSFITHIQ